jgi:prolipoprotein diacylglyceryltransferase
MGYPLGRIVFEKMRSDEAHVILGQRVNVWTSILVFVLGLVLFRVSGRTREDEETTDAPQEPTALAEDPPDPTARPS